MEKNYLRSIPKQSFQNTNIKSIIEENSQLKEKLNYLSELLASKDKELAQLNFKNENNIMKINSEFDKHINEYKKMINNCKIMKNQLIKSNQNNSLLKNEINNKTKYINFLKQKQKKNNYSQNEPNSNKDYDGNVINFMLEQINNIYLNFFGSNIEDEIDNNNNEEEISPFEYLIKNIQVLSEKLNEYKNENNLQIKGKSNLYNKINDEKDEKFTNFYEEFMNTMKNFCAENQSNDNFYYMQKLPDYYLGNDKDKNYNDIIETINILINYSDTLNSQLNEANNIEGKDEINEISNKNMKENNNNRLVSELKKRLDEMSKLLIKNNDYLNKSREENNEYQNKYTNLEKMYNSLVIKYSKLVKKYKNNSENEQNENLTYQGMEDNSFQGKIINKETFNNIKKNPYNNKKFFKNDKNEKTLNLILDRLTNGEFSGRKSKKQLSKTSKNENKNIVLNLSDDNEQKLVKEREKIYQMEGKIQS